jgi:hypothetical protein
MGNYETATSYAVADAVSFGGSTYVSLVADNFGNTPDQSPAEWAVLAAEGAAGPAGPAGAAGAPGAVGAIGPAGATGMPGPPASFQGEWLTGTAYRLGDVVAYGGSSFVALAGNLGHEPDLSPGLWAVLAAAGAAGAPGPAGATGAEGPSGYPGQPGAAGPAGPVGVAGPAGLNWRGEFSGNAAYGVGDGVSYDGASYISLTGGNQGNVPAGSAAQWGLLAAAGEAGLTGPGGAAGAAGPAGPAGANGAAGPPGPAGINFRGAWGSGPNYAIDDAVTFGGATYLATAANSAVEPDQNASVWTVLAVAGAAGPTGAAGAAATVQVGTVTTGAAGSNATVVNAGTGQAAVLNFSIPQGAQGLAGAGGGGAGAGAEGINSMVHLVSYNDSFYSVNSPNQGPTETAAVLTWVPNGCTATRLTVFSQQAATITITLRAGLPGAMADSGLSCSVANGASCTASGSVAVPAGSFLDLSVAQPDSVPSGVWTALSCN